MIEKTIREFLDKPVKHEDIAKDLAEMGIENPTFRDYLVLNVLMNTAENGTLNDLCKLAAVMQNEIEA